MSRARRVAVGARASGRFTALLGCGMTPDAREIPSRLVGQLGPMTDALLLEQIETMIAAGWDTTVEEEANQ